MGKGVSGGLETKAKEGIEFSLFSFLFSSSEEERNDKKEIKLFG